MTPRRREQLGSGHCSWAFSVSTTIQLPLRGLSGPLGEHMDYRQHILDAVQDMPGISSGELEDTIKERLGLERMTYKALREQRDLLHDEGYLAMVKVPLEGTWTRHAWFLSE